MRRRITRRMFESRPTEAEKSTSTDRSMTQRSCGAGLDGLYHSVTCTSLIESSPPATCGSAYSFRVMVGAQVVEPTPAMWRLLELEAWWAGFMCRRRYATSSIADSP